MPWALAHWRSSHCSPSYGVGNVITSPASSVTLGVVDHGLAAMASGAAPLAVGADPVSAAVEEVVGREGHQAQRMQLQL
jgi:hypothetical protein